mgnify:CR=1 FL=1
MKLTNLETKFLGRNIFYYEEIDSTQKEVFRRAEKNIIKNGTLIYADIQTSGKGTHGRTWYTDERNNIAFSLFVEMNCDIYRLMGLTKKIAEIILDIFYKRYGICLEIKEPNDIYYKTKKVGGILTETKIVSNKVKYLVLGIGINTNKTFFVDDIKDVATSIKKEFEITINTETFMSDFCNNFEVEINERMS